ncbi:MAG: carbohydrate porin [Bacteroidota bacterium]|nr:carbohydrate porin [Bacteroidota bacterium]
MLCVSHSTHKNNLDSKEVDLKLSTPCIHRRLWREVAISLFFLLTLNARAQEEVVQNWSFHFQQTIVVQGHSNFAAAYTGQNSLLTREAPQTSLTATFFLGRRLWKGAEMYADAELTGGNGLSGATGVAGFLNAETFRIVGPTPQLTLSQLHVRQTFSSGEEVVSHAGDANQLGGTIPARRLSLTLGKISITDYFDLNKYCGDPRTQFLNWALMANGAWDYPADTRGYTWGLVAELVLPPWALRFSSAMVPTEANMSDMDMNIGKARSETVEIEREYELGTRKGVVRLLGFYTQARMGNYRQALQLPPGQVDIVTTREYGRTKDGLGINVEQTFSNDVGLTLRAGWNDGENETWMFTEIDRSVSTAVVLKGNLWQMPDDNAGFALVLNGLSNDHRDYLKAGGYGFIIGDGNLNYAPEFIVESFYSFSIQQWNLSITPDYQFVLHPAYNKDRGPVHVFGARCHVSF